MINIDGLNVVFCYIAWMENYRGPSTADPPWWRGRKWPSAQVQLGRSPKSSKYLLGESWMFKPFPTRGNRLTLFGDVQHRWSTFVQKYGTRATIVWLAADPEDHNFAKVVAVYREATLHEKHKSLRSYVLAKKLPPPLNTQVFNVSCAPEAAFLVPMPERSCPPFLPGTNRNRFQSTAKCWFGPNDANEQATMTEFVRTLLARQATPGASHRKDDPQTVAPITFGEALARYRRGQAAFRSIVLNAYDGTCPVTGCKIETLLEACHIIPVAEPAATHGTENGVLLRIDLHALLDQNLISIHPGNGTLRVSSKLGNGYYRTFDGKKLTKFTGGTSQTKWRHKRFVA